MVAPKFSVANPSLVNSQINPYMNLFNIERPSDTAVNIQHSCMPSWNSTRAPQSPSLSPMDSSSPSKGDYAERMVTISNRMDIEMSNPETTTSPTYMPQFLPVHNEAASNAPL